MAIQTLCSDRVRMAMVIYFLYILTFSNGCILHTIGSIYTKVEGFLKIGLYFMTMWINSY